MKKRVADIIMDVLADNGINQAFCVVGGGSMFLNNALGISKRIKTVFNHHEQACAMACEGYTKYSGNPALCCVTTGPGGTNTLTGVMGSYVESLPMIIISGQARFDTTVAQTGLPLRQRGVQEFNIVDTVKTMTKYAKMVINPLEIKQEVQKAFDIAMSGRKGPVWLDIPQNVQNTMVEEDDLLPVLEKPARIEAKKEEIETIFALLKQAKRPVILAGSGIRTGQEYDSFLKFLESKEVPVVGACVQPDIMFHKHPLYFGSTGSVGTRCGNLILQNADILVVLGASLTFTETGFVQENFAPNAHIIMVNIDEYEPQKPGLNISTFIHSDLADFFEKTKNISLKAPEEWMRYAQKLKEKFNLFEGAEQSNQERVNSYNFWELYSKYESEENITILGNNSGISPKLQIGNIKKEHRTIANINCGSMGYDVPAALGCSFASKKPVTLVTGDGSFMMNMQELQTIAHHNLPVRIAIFSNDGYNGIRQTCKNYFNGKNVGCDNESGISFPSFEKIAQAFGFPYRLCKNNSELTEAIQWLLNQPSFAFLEVLQKYENPPVPRVVSRLRNDGTSEPAFLQDMFPFLSKEELEELML